MIRPSKLAAVLLIGLWLPGCSNKNEAVVTGAVTVDGAPAPPGSISFFPLDGKSRSSGADIVDGKYTANVPLGNMRIEIRVPKVVGQRRLYNTPNSPTQPLFQESLPTKYNSDSQLQLDVQAGHIKKDFPLSTK